MMATTAPRATPAAPALAPLLGPPTATTAILAPTTVATRAPAAATLPTPMPATISMPAPPGTLVPLGRVEAEITAAASGRARSGCDPVSLPDRASHDGHGIAGFRPQFRYGAHHLVAGDDGELKGHVAGVHVLVTTADAGAVDFQQEFVVADGGAFHLLYFDAAGCRHHGCLDRCQRQSSE